LSPTRRWAIFVALGALAVAVIDVWWVATHRHGYPFDIDEAGYTTFALLEHFGWESGGLSGWWDAVLNQAPHAPLLPALTSVVLAVRGGVMEGFGVLAGFLVLMTLAVYGVGERLAGPRLGALAALVAATSPGAFFFSREYIFALPAAALLACSVYLLIRSDGLRRRGWAVACGVSIGLMLLARSMTIAFVPGLLIAAALAIWARRESDGGTPLLNLGLMVAAGIAVAAPWYAPNMGPVLDYLTGYGYGTQSESYGSVEGFLSWSRFRTPLVNILEENFYLPMATVLLAGLVAVAVSLVGRLREAAERGAYLRRLAATDALTVAIVVVAGYGALWTSRNGGFGFTLPIALLIPTLSVLALRLYPRATAPTLVAVAALVVVTVVANLNLSDATTRTRTIDVPGLGAVAYAGGVAPAVASTRVQVPGPDTRFDEHDKAWLRADEAVVDQLLGWADRYGVVPVTAFGSHGHLLNTNDVQLAAVLRTHATIPMVQLRPEPSDSAGTYREQLAGEEAFHPEVLLTVDRNQGDFDPTITEARAEWAARALGFRLVRTMRLPDGRELRFWREANARDGPTG
jgi:4-amino-4-deoxy-L-arabinose transferase-like glycosyltransferase